MSGIKRFVRRAISVFRSGRAEADLAHETNAASSPPRAFVPLMLVVGLLATLGPARRCLRIDPTEALKADG